MINILGIPIGGVQLFNTQAIIEGFVFSLILMLSLHYGIVFLAQASREFRMGKWAKGFLRVLFVAFLTAVFVYVGRLNVMYMILSYIFLSIYVLLILSRGFFAWYVRTDEISHKLDRILKILEAKEK
jgi:hypothetical protein